VCAWATGRVSPSLLVLRVASFNTRAIRVYERAGFRATGAEIANSYGNRDEFVRMERGPFTL
jgi:RimJ/RimL family protein N-acetyltransferase